MRATYCALDYQCCRLVTDTEMIANSSHTVITKPREWVCSLMCDRLPLMRFIVVAAFINISGSAIDKLIIYYLIMIIMINMV